VLGAVAQFEKVERGIAAYEKRSTGTVELSGIIAPDLGPHRLAFAPTLPLAPEGREARQRDPVVRRAALATTRRYIVMLQINDVFTFFIVDAFDSIESRSLDYLAF
jgi:hypothetical protein